MKDRLYRVLFVLLCLGIAAGVAGGQGQLGPRGITGAGSAGYLPVFTAGTQVGSANVTWTTDEPSIHVAALDANVLVNKLTDGPGSADGGAYVGTGSYNCGFDQNSAVDCLYNYTGFHAGSTQFRNMKFLDGKGGDVAKFTGSTKAFDAYGNATLGTTTSNSHVLWGKTLFQTATSSDAMVERHGGGPGLAFKMSGGTLASPTPSPGAGGVLGQIGVYGYGDTQYWGRYNAWQINPSETWSNTGNGFNQQWYVTATGTQTNGVAMELLNDKSLHVLGAGQFDGALNSTGNLTENTVRVVTVAGTSLTKVGGTLNVNLPGASCSPGSHVRAISADGTGTCAADAVAPSVTSTVSLSASVNDWAPAGYTAGTTTTISVSATASTWSVTGLAATGAVNGTRIVIRNDGTFNITFPNQSASSTAANRFVSSPGTSIILEPNDLLELEYNSAVSRWNVAAKSGRQRGNMIVDGNAAIGSGLVLSQGAVDEISGTLNLQSSHPTGTVNVGANTFSLALMKVFGPLTTTGNLTVGSGIVMTASDGNIVAATRLRVGNGIYLEDGPKSLSCDYLTNSGVTCYLNKNGYAGGTTQFRSMEIDNGKGASIVNFDGASKAATFSGNTVVAGGKLVDTGTPPSVTGCGTSPTVTGGSWAFNIHVGTGTTTTCDVTGLTFNSSTPTCQITGSKRGRFYISVLSATAMTIANEASTNLAGDDIYVTCVDH